MAENMYYLAMYDIRGKQAFIFRNNHIREIIGGSCIIRDCFKNHLYPSAKEYRNESLKDAMDGVDVNSEAIYVFKPGEAFSDEQFKKRMEGKQYIGELIYDGGGNFIMLYKNEQAFIETNKRFTLDILKKYNGLHVLCTGIPIDGSFSDYKNDREKLYEKHRQLEAKDNALHPVNTMPFVQVDPETSLPLTTNYSIARERQPEKLSTESAAKYDAYFKEVPESKNSDYGESILDEIIRGKGDSSKLAVIFIDGNNMGAQVQSCLTGMKTYEECIGELRKFSADIEKKYVTDRLKAIDVALEEQYGQEEKRKRYRHIVHAGDEMSFICRAEDALRLVKAYFKELPSDCSSCAGIALFHSHAPYHAAYEIAEQCCESGKKFMKKRGETDTRYIDFHICQGAIGMDIEEIREHEVGNLCSKPWRLSPKAADDVEKNVVTLEEIEEIVEKLQLIGSRTNIKGLALSAKNSLAEFDMEMERIYAHQKKEVREQIESVFKNPAFCGERRRNMIYDISIIYDQWFKIESILKDGQKTDSEDNE